MLRIFILITICLYSLFSFGQGPKDEGELIKLANETFEEGKFMQALPLFSQLVSLNPSDPDFNFKFGTCVIYSGVDKETAIKHLTFSTKKNVKDARAYYYLGLARHLNYEFRLAKESYATFLKKSDEKLQEQFDAGRKIEMCSNGESLLSNLTDIVVIDKKEVAENDFFRYYDLEDVGGKVIAKPEEFITKNDKKRGLTGVVHFDRSSDYIFYSSYGKDGDNLDLYRVQPLAGGGFSKPEKIKGSVNTGFDEDFAFLHSDGETLYFASKGHSSMGGFDVFKAIYDVSTDEYNQVENLDFAINTPDDDLFYLVDSTKTIAYFASGRSSALDNLHVYKVRVESIPLNLLILQGDFISQIDASQKNAKITITDDFSGKPIGEFYANKNTGKYAIPFERSGTYKFEIEAEGSMLIHEGLVEIPALGKAAAFKQELILSSDNGQERLQIKNYFDEELDANIAELSKDILRKKAGLEVNADEMEEILEQQKIETQRPVADAGKVAGFAEEKSNADIAAEMKTLSADYELESKTLKTRTEEAYAEAKILMNSAEEKFQKGKETLAEADESDPESYIEKTNEGNILLAQSKKEFMEAQSILEVIKSIDAYSSQLEETSKNLSAQAGVVESSSDFDEVVEILKAEKERQREVAGENASSPENQIDKAADFTNNELNNLVNRIEQNRTSEADLTRKISNKEKILETTKKKSDREDLEIEISSLENELESVKDDLIRETGKVEVLGYDAENFALQSEYLNKIYSEEHVFQGEAQSYDINNLEAEIASSENYALEANSLIPEGTEAVALASEEVKERIELKSLNSKLSSIDSGVELKGLAGLQDSYFERLAGLAILDNTSADEARTRAVNKEYVKQLGEEITEIDRALENEALSAEEKDFLTAEKAALKSEIEDIPEIEYLTSQVSDEKVEQIIEEYAAEENQNFENWKQNESSFSGLTDAESLSLEVKNELDEVIGSKTAEMALSDNATEILQLESEINELKSASDKLENITDQRDFLIDIYEEEVTADPAAKKRITEEYLSVLETKVGNLERKSDQSSGLEKARYEEILTDLNKEKIIVGTALDQLNNAVSDEVVSNDQSDSTGQEPIEIIEVFPSNNSTEDITTQEFPTVYNTEEDVLTDVLPEYDTRMSEIDSDVSIDLKTKLQDKVAVNSELISNLDAKISEVNESLENSDSEEEKVILNSQLNSLNELKNKSEENSENWNSEIETISENENFALQSETNPNNTEDSTVSDENTDPIDSDSQTETGTDAETGTQEEITQDETTQDETTQDETAQDGTGVQVETAQDETAQNDSENQKEAKETAAAELIVLTEEEVKVELTSLPDDVKDDLPEIYEETELLDPNYLRSSDKIEELVEEDELLSSSVKNRAQIEVLSSNLDVLYSQEAATEKEQVKLDKKIAKLEKKIAKKELKNSPKYLTAAQWNYEETRHEFNDQLDNLTEEQKASPAFMARVEKLRTQAEVLAEDVEIYRELAENTKKDDVKKNELYNEATAKQIAAVENLEKAQWMLENAETLAPLSEQSFASLEENEGEVDAVKESITADPIAENKENERLSAEVVDLADYSKSLTDGDELLDQWEVSDEEKEIIARSSAFVDYTQKSSELEENVSKLKELDEALALKTSEAEDLNAQADELEATIESLDSEEEKTEATAQVKRIRAAASVEYANVEQKQSERETLIQQSESIKSNLAEMKQEFNKDNLLTLALNEPNASAEATSFSTSDSVEMYEKTLDLKNAVNQTVFLKVKDVYNEDRPIPVDVELPEGLVYKVQVGAFRNPIPQTLYNEFAPVTGEKLTNGITRYTAGLFTTETSAKGAKTDIRGIGFSDAFVVAYLNGKRISLAEARNIQPGTSAAAEEYALQNTGNSSDSSSTETEQLENQPNVSQAETEENRTVNNQYNNSQAGITENDSSEKLPTDSQAGTTVNSSTENGTSETEYYENYPDAAEANQVEALEGIFYTVQVGVYSKPVPSNQIYNIQPLNSEKLTNGNIRYTSGIYSNLTEAVRRKEEIQSLGISDAFVTAYSNGKRITISAAKQAKSGGTEFLEVENLESEVPVVTPQPEVIEDIPEPVEYVIYIGTFTDEVPANVARAMLFLEDSRGIIQKKDGNSVSYYTRPVKSKQTAEAIKAEFEGYEVYSVTVQEVK